MLSRIKNDLRFAGALALVMLGVTWAVDAIRLRRDRGWNAPLRERLRNLAGDSAHLPGCAYGPTRTCPCPDLCRSADECAQNALAWWKNVGPASPDIPSGRSAAPQQRDDPPTGAPGRGEPAAGTEGQTANEFSRPWPWSDAESFRRWLRLPNSQAVEVAVDAYRWLQQQPWEITSRVKATGPHFLQLGLWIRSDTDSISVNGTTYEHYYTPDQARAAAEDARDLAELLDRWASAQEALPEGGGA